MLVMSLPLMLALVPALIALNAFFVAGEYAVVAARPVHLEALRRRGYRRAAGAMERLKRDPASAIGAIQVCITITNLLLGWLGEPAMSRVLLALFGPLAEAIPEAVFTPLSVAVSFLVVTLLTVVFSELLPKALTLRYVPPVVALTAAPVVVIGAAVRPLVWVMNGMANLVTLPLGLGRVETMEEQEASVEELRLLATEAAREGVLSPAERSLILNTLALNHRLANRVMVPRMQVQFLDLRKSMDDNRKVMGEHLHTRYPLCDGDLDKIIGVVRTKQFLTAYHAAADTSVLALIADEAIFAPEISTLGQVLALFSEKKTEFAILVDEYGGIAGIVTLRDIVDDLLGAVDESKALMAEALRGDATAQKPAPGRRVVRGDLAVHELARLLGTPDWAADEEAATVAGLIQSRLGEIGQAGAAVEVDGVRLKVLRSDGRSIRRVEVRPAAPGNEPGG